MERLSDEDVKRIAKAVCDEMDRRRYERDRKESELAMKVYSASQGAIGMISRPTSYE